MPNNYTRLRYRILQRITSLASNAYMALFCKLAGFSVKGCSFYGLPNWHFHPGSEVSIGTGCVFRSQQRSNLIGINHPCMISTFTQNSRLSIGNNCGFSGTVIGAFNSISIGNNVRCGANTVISDGDWHMSDQRVGGPLPVKICDNVWLGLNVVVLKGAIIGENSIIGAGSVVAGEIPSNVIAAGNPCRVIKSI